MPNNDPFAGMALSQQVAPPKLDQRLFSDRPAPAPAPVEKPPPEQSQTAKSPATGPERHSPPSTKQAPDAPRHTHFDLENEALHKATFAFTQPELEVLEDLKLEFRRDHDTKVTKNDVVRAAVHMLVEDHATNKQRSYISRKLDQR
jgi:hypothetical protein